VLRFAAEHAHLLCCDLSLLLLLLLQTDGPVKKPAFNFNSINKRSPAARLNLSRHKARVPSSRRSAQPAFSASSCAN